MTPSQLIFERFGVLLAADTTTLAPAADPPAVMLVKDVFTPSLTLIPADLVEADFDGYAQIAAPVGAQQQTLDPNTGDSLVRMKPPAGGWFWETTGITNLPQTIYGFALINDAQTAIYGSELFDEPFVLTATNQQILIDNVIFRMLLNSVE